jgi:hypothetical protein
MKKKPAYVTQSSKRDSGRNAPAALVVRSTEYQVPVYEDPLSNSHAGTSRIGLFFRAYRIESGASPNAQPPFVEPSFRADRDDPAIAEWCGVRQDVGIHRDQPHARPHFGGIEGNTHSGLPRNGDATKLRFDEIAHNGTNTNSLSNCQDADIQVKTVAGFTAVRFVGQFQPFRHARRVKTRKLSS